MPKSKKTSVDARNIIINKNGVGEDAAVQDLNKIATMNNSDALDVALALQQIIRGQNSLLENQDKMGQEIAKLKQHMAEVDQVTEKFNNDQKKFFEDVLSKSESLKKTGDDKDKVIAQGAQMFTKAVAEAKAGMINDRLKFDEELAHMKKITVMSPGVPELVNVQGHMEMRIFPEEVRIKHKIWRLPPGQPMEVPEVVAKALQIRRTAQQETYERQAALQKNMEHDDLENEMQRINAKYGTNGGIVVDAE